MRESGFNQVDAGLGSSKGGVSRQRDVRQSRERMSRRQRLDGEDVQPSVSDLARIQRVDQRSLVEQRAAGGVDEDGAMPHRCDSLARQKAACLIGERQVERHDVAAGEQRVDALATFQPADEQKAQLAVRPPRRDACVRPVGEAMRREDEAAGVELEPGEYELKLAAADPDSTSALPGNTGLIAGEIGDPRTYGLTLAYKF